MSNASPSASPHIAVVILTWNGRALTLACLESLESARTPDTRIIVVDNGSSDGTADAVRERYGERVVVLENESNLGFSEGNNAGISFALEQGARFVLLLNNDTTVDANFLVELVRPMVDNPNVGITVPKIYYYTPSNRIWFAGGEVLLARGVARHIGIRERDVGQYDVARDTDYATGCALMTRAEVIERIGMLDGSYVAYFEDTDFSMRARCAGYRIRYVPAARVWHKISASTGGQLSRRKITLKFRSTWKFFLRYARPYHWLTIPFFFLADVIRILVLVLFGRIRDTGHDTAKAPDEQNQEKLR